MDVVQLLIKILSLQQRNIRDCSDIINLSTTYLKKEQNTINEIMKIIVGKGMITQYSIKPSELI